MGENSELLEIAILAAKTAGKIQREKFGTPISIKNKGAIDLVTEVDLASENAIREVLQKLCPNSSILGEEGGKSGAGDDLWIIDPLDGTTNYAHRVPIFCVSIGFERKGQIIAGVVYDPMRDELFSASKGGGAHLNGAKALVSDKADIGSALLATGFPYDHRTNPKDIFGAFKALTLAGQGVRRLGAAALDLVYVGAGRFDAFWEVGLKPWDVSAGRLFVEEAGGKVSGFHGEPYDHYNPDITASNGLIHGRIIEILSAHA